MEKQRRNDEEEAAKRQCVPSTPPPPHPTHAPRAARDFRPCAEKRPVASRIPPTAPRPPRLLPSPTLIDPTLVPRATQGALLYDTHADHPPPGALLRQQGRVHLRRAPRRGRHHPQIDRGSHAQAHDPPRQARPDDRRMEVRARRGARQARAPRRARGHRRGGARAAPGVHRARRGGGQQRRPSPAESADPAPQRPAQGTAAEQARRRRGRGLYRAPGAVARVGERGGGPGTDIGRVVKVAHARNSGSKRKRRSKTRGDEHGGQASRGGARGEATGLRRRVHAVAHQGPERGRGGQRDGAAAHLAARRAGASQLSADLLRREPIPRKLRETPMRPGAVETKRVATAREATAKPAMVFGRNPGGGGGGEGGFDERVRLAAAGATAHSRILLETGKLRPSSAPASRDGRASKMPLRVLPAAERVARAHGHLSAAKECATRKTSTRAQSARKQAFGYSFASSTNAAAGDRTASVIAPFAPRTATLAEDVRREDERDGDEVERRAGDDEFDDEFQKSFQKSFGASPAGLLESRRHRGGGPTVQRERPADVADGGTRREARDGEGERPGRRGAAGARLWREDAFDYRDGVRGCAHARRGARGAWRAVTWTSRTSR